MGGHANVTVRKSCTGLLKTLVSIIVASCRQRIFAELQESIMVTWILKQLVVEPAGI